ncbi:hypothetical protein [Pseudomonas sp. NPDC079086]|uniref:hypothetical protein n=1 Tax=unclassified Pseudomonas TaxID=196821 RepID=UPI0037C63228
MKVISVSNSKSNKLTYGKTYEVIGIEANSFRIVNDLNDPCLYEPSDFEISDPTEPLFWISSLGEDGERYAYPISWSSPGFFEDFHDHIAGVVKQFWQEYRQLYG